MTMDAWLSTPQFAELAGITTRAATKGLSAIVLGTTPTWRGAWLKVRVIAGNAGRGGRRYEVAASSLPLSLQLALEDDFGPVQMPLPLPAPVMRGTPADEARWWAVVLQPVLCQPKGSSERAAEIAKLVGTAPIDWKGAPRRLSRNTLYGRIAKFEAAGMDMSVLMRKPRSDFGKQRVILARDLDKHLDDDASRDELRNALRLRVKGLVQKGTERRLVLDSESEWLSRQIIARGYRPNEPQAFLEQCEIAVRAVYDAELHAGKAVYRFRHDRKRHDDTRPHASRTPPKRPAECYVLDVHHSNVRVEHQGKVGTPKIIGLLDWGTMRLKVHAIFFVEGGGVRNEDNIELIREVFTDLEQQGWGVPENIYCDNGKEYGFTRFLDQMMHLNAASLGFSGRQTRVITSLAYNGAAKRIENIWSTLNKTVWRHMQGFIGDDRMNPMEVAPGKLSKPMASFEQFAELLAGAVHAYNWMNYRSGHLKGKSPYGYLQECIDAGWRPTVLDPTDFDGIFVDRETRDLRNHAFALDNRIWIADELLQCFDPKVVVCVPYGRRAYNEVRVETLDGRYLCIAKTQEQRAWNDPRGSVSTARRRTLRDSALRAHERDATKADPLSQLIARGAGRPAPSAQAGGIMRVNLDGASAQVATPGEGQPVTQIERDIDVQSRARDSLIAKLKLQKQAGAM